MARRFFIGCGTDSSRGRGFTLVEALISTAIVGLLALFVVTDLRTSAEQEQLVTAQRLIVSDLRSLQSRALAAENIHTCDAAGKKIVCELNATMCDVPANCVLAPPLSLGVHFAANSSTYTLFGDVDPSAKDWMNTAGAHEAFFTRDLHAENAPNVIIDRLDAPGSVPDAQIAFERQNGVAHLDPCATAPCTEATTLVITLRQTKTGNTKTVTFDAVTGRVSFD